MHTHVQVTCATCAHKTAKRSEREHGRVLSRSKHVNERLAHEQPNGDTDCNCDHSTPNVNPIARCGDRPTASLRETRLEIEKERSVETASRPHWHGPGT
jgi:hypothetical protein